MTVSNHQPPTIDEAVAELRRIFGKDAYAVPVECTKEHMTLAWEAAEEEVTSLRVERDEALARVEELRGALERVDAYFTACARQWSENDGRLVTESGAAIEGSEEVERLCNVAANAVSAALSTPNPQALRRLRAKIREEALEEAAKFVEALERFPKALRGYKLNDSRDGFRNIADHLRALADAAEKGTERAAESTTKDGEK